MSFLNTLLLGIPSGILAAVAASKPWSELATTLGNPATVKTAGEEPLASALALVALAAWGAILVTRGRVRRALAVLGCLAGAGLVAVAAVAFEAAPRAVRRAAETPGIATPATHLTAWYWAACAAAVLTTGALAIAVRAAPTWPTMSSRYDSPDAAPTNEEPATNFEIWKALDAGDDPTDSGRSADGDNH